MLAMLRLLRRRAVTGALSVLVAASFMFVAATSANATPVVVAPLIPEAAAAAGEAVAAGCAATGPGCAIVGAAALGYGAWWAWSNRDILLNWTDQTVGQAENSTRGAPTSYGVWAWTSDLPDPTGGPFLQSAGEVFHIQCEVTLCAGYTWTEQCVASNGVVSTGTADQGGTSGVGTVNRTGGYWCMPPARVGAISVRNWAGGVIYWKANGNWDQTRTTTVTETCTTPGGATQTVTATTSTSVTDTARTTSIPACPAGTYSSGFKVADGAPGAIGDTRINWQTNSGIETTYPACFTGTSPGPGGCTLTVTYQGVACTDANGNCVDWYDNSAFGASGYACMWGPYSLPLVNCDMMRYAYVPGSTVDPATGLPTNPVPTASPSPTTAPQSQPTAGPNPQPSSVATLTPWTQAPNPFPTDGSTPTAAPQPPEPPPSGQNCMESGWSWNPVSWVYVPVRCVLVWAFVPDSAAVAQVQTEASSAWSSSSPGLWTAAAFTALGPLGNIGSSESGTYACGIPVHFPFYTGQSIDFVMLNSCTAPLDTLAPIVKGFLTAVVIVNGLWLSLRILGAAFGWQLPSIGRGSSE